VKLLKIYITLFVIGNGILRIFLICSTFNNEGHFLFTRIKAPLFHLFDYYYYYFFFFNMSTQ
jgi:hypothetical protein